MDDSPCPAGHNTPVPLERSSPGSFKRLLGGCDRMALVQVLNHPAPVVTVVDMSDAVLFALKRGPNDASRLRPGNGGGVDVAKGVERKVVRLDQGKASNRTLRWDPVVAMRHSLIGSIEVEEEGVVPGLATSRLARESPGEGVFWSEDIVDIRRLANTFAPEEVANWLACLRHGEFMQVLWNDKDFIRGPGRVGAILWRAFTGNCRGDKSEKNCAIPEVHGCGRSQCVVIRLTDRA